jgi:F0F1-type ATP synthase assembly protein I
VAAAPCGVAAGTSTLNVVPDRGTSNTAIVGPGAGGAVCVTSNIVTHILVDVTGWIIDGYVGLAPWRALDSRLNAA